MSSLFDETKRMVQMPQKPPLNEACMKAQRTVLLVLNHTWANHTRAVWDYRNDRPRNGLCRMHGGLSTGPRRKRGGTPARVRKPLENCRHEAAEIREGDFLYGVYALTRCIDILVRSRNKR